jgi:hypothetical protein
MIKVYLQSAVMHITCCDFYHDDIASNHNIRATAKFEYGQNLCSHILMNNEESASKLISVSLGTKFDKCEYINKVFESFCDILLMYSNNLVKI